ncbi:MAG: YihA family ribosome biogenesis GTP-binding protein [Candidatus Yonathbacteria bacterium]|nr:YihA family ribosome biogenesis GTP-binding protein [Candidatus Yonathbacteria bacterium]
MEIKSAEFIKGIIGTNNILSDHIPSVAFVGRSNVGKSSVINSLVLRKNLVKPSARAGKTKEINFFLINKQFYFVDLPGVGYALMKATSAEKLRKLILWYLTGGEAKIDLVILIVDSGIKPMPHDKEMISVLREKNINFVVVANKIDRLNQTERAHNLKKIESHLGAPIIPYSARTKEGRDVLWEEINKVL